MARIETPRRVRGTQDIFGDEQRRFATVIETFERVRRLYCFQRVDLPVFEATEVFARSIGETTDVVSKEMYTFPDRGGDSLTLRPEFTAGIARAFLTEGWQQYAPLKVATSGAVFRYERPQKGRYRQFHQIDAEILGAPEPAADVELLVMADQLLHELGIAEGVTLQLNTLGDAETRDAWRAGLVAHFEAHRGDLSEDSLTRLEKNPMRFLDSKDPRDRPIADAAPDIDAYLTADARAFFDAVTAGLDAAAWPLTGADARIVEAVVPPLASDRLFTAVSMPNPHLVTFVDAVDEAELVAVGERCEAAPAWLPNRANVSFVEVRGGDLFVRTFERGVGLTDSCGSAMAASSFAACLTGRLAYGAPITVFNKGGLVRAVVAEDAMVSLSGNATWEWRGSVDIDLMTEQAGSLRVEGHADAEIAAWAQLADAASR